MECLLLEVTKVQALQMADLRWEEGGKKVADLSWEGGVGAVWNVRGVGGRRGWLGRRCEKCRGLQCLLLEVTKVLQAAADQVGENVEEAGQKTEVDRGGGRVGALTAGFGQGAAMRQEAEDEHGMHRWVALTDSKQGCGHPQP